MDRTAFRLSVTLVLVAFFLASCINRRDAVVVPADSRIVIVTKKPLDEENTVTCAEPSQKADDAFKDFTELTLDFVTRYHDPDRFAQNVDPSLAHERRATSVGQFERRKDQRVHSMRELLFDICLAYVNDLIDRNAYERMLVKVIDRTAALHAMEVLLYELDQAPIDTDTRHRLIDLASEIILK